jgi:glutathione peroxidase
VLAGCAEPSAPTAASALPDSGDTALPQSLHGFTVNRLNGKPEELKTYEGKVVLLVNTASECGYTPQYQGLETLWQEYQSKGVVVLGFPSNDFGGQEPGSSQEIATFCQRNYGVSFPMFEKVVTKGPKAAPLFKFLSAAAGEPKWNFHKYLVDKQGKVVKAFPSSVTPESAELRSAIDAALTK